MDTRQGWWAAGLLAIALGLAGWSVCQHRAPPVLPADAPQETFSALRAFDHTKVIARQPHPAGTAANAAVADYIAGQIRSFGLTPQYQDTALHCAPGQASTVHNVLARLRGTGDSRRAVLLMAHYDSVAWAPGAADDGAGVVTLLEAMRALVAGKKLPRDVIFLFTDGEEGRRPGGSGCRGAQAFVLKHPWFDDAAVVLNFDARGNRGPAYMYETPERNGWLIAQLQEADCRPLATSFMYEVFHAMPVQSDYSRFKQRGVPGFNMAFVDGLPIYHSALDDPAHLDLASVQHMGHYAVDLARHLANQPLDNTSGPSQVYFNTLGYRMIRYPASWVLPLCLACILLVGAVLGAGCRRGHLALRRIIVSTAAFLGCVALAAGIAAAVAVLGYQWRGIYVLYRSDPLTLGCLAAAVLITLVSLRWLSQRVGTANTVAGVLCAWILLLATSSLLIPGASYLPLWPIVGATLGLAALIGHGKPGEPPGLWAIAAATLGAAPGLLLWPGIMVGLYTCLTIIFAVIPCVGAAMLLGLLATPLAALAPRAARTGYAALAVAAIAGLAWGAWWPGFSAPQPQFANLAYALDADSGKGWWLSSDPEPNAWTSGYIPQGTVRAPAAEFFPIGGGPIPGVASPPVSDRYLRAPAPSLELPPPRIDVLSDVTQSTTRRLTLHVASPRGAPVLVLYAEPGTRVLGGSVEGIPLLPVKGRWFLSYSILPKSGITLVLEVTAGQSVRFRAVDHSYGFPPGLVKPRPAWMGPKPNTPDFNRDPLKSDETIVAGSYAI